MKKFLILVLINFIFLEVKTQEILFPVNPNNQNYLSGNLGELRGSHFHMGIDIKTFGRINEPIYAADDGFVERIFISGTGYGKAIYLKHNNGTKTVYAHLNKFNSELDKYSTSYQYRNKLFKVNLFPGSRFFYKKGDLIGYSGNSGSSGGPHLHFELRDSLDNVYDPLRYGFKEIKDNRNPIIDKISLKTLNINSRINNGFGLKKIDLSKSINLRKNNFIQAKGEIGISVLAYDKLDGFENKVGIKKIRLYVDDTLRVENEINLLSYSETKSVKRYIEYDIFQRNREQFVKLYQDDGNKLNFHQDRDKGVIRIGKNETKKIKVVVFDSFENNNSFTFYLKSNEVSKNRIENFNLFKNEYYNIDNTLVIRSKLKNRDNIEYEENSHLRSIDYSFKDENFKYYLFDLRKNSPSKIILDDSKIDLNFLDPVFIGKKYKIEEDDFSINFSKSSLFDTLYFEFLKDESYKFKNSHPIKNNIVVTLKTKKANDQNKTHIYAINDDDISFVGGKWDENEISFSTNSLLNYKILKDTIKPEIQPKTINQNIISFKIDDKMSGINSYEASINNEWILFEYDNKNKMIISKKKNPNIPFKGKFVLIVSDNAENKSIYNINI
ncbi:MAG: M23 family metallopeptidase [Flammeovirgaceae bacterium TMED290]|nr:MAG: M23 family metallopeptidase [Flammeovirgaceae bacterium TMED290]